MEQQPDIDATFMRLAVQVASLSTDRSTGVGCVLVTPEGRSTTACNGFTRGARNLEERHQRPAKYKWTEHAERNVIYLCAQLGISTQDCTAYVNWTPCVDCARALVQAGITRVVMRPADLEDPMWGEDFVIALAMLEEAGVEVVEIDGPMGSKR